MLERSSGILLHISSLRGSDGIGTFGQEAYDFVDFLKKSKQKLWQILPLGTTSYGDSPYQSFSAFAGNPYFINLEEIIKRGALTSEVVKKYESVQNNDIVNYENLYNNKIKLLKIAYINEKDIVKNKIEIFKKKNNYWIDDYGLYMAIKNKNSGQKWNKWKKEEKFAYINTIKKLKKELFDEIEFYIYLQVLFFDQWSRLKKYANENDVKIVGDIPIFIAEDSVDSWLNTELFLFDQNKNMKVVAGCPPDAFSIDGQLWGNPLYNWKIMRRRKYKWWIERMKSAFDLYDIVRIDHFRGFDSYWEIPAGSSTARPGKWVKGPGIKFFKALKNSLGDVPIIVEDLGFTTKSVKKLVSDSGYPGMKIAQFSIDGHLKNEHLSGNVHKNTTIYTGTHDNETLKGWYDNLNEKNQRYIKNYMENYLDIKISDDYSMNDIFIESIFKSKAVFAIVPMQDLLNLDNSARMNIPSTLGGNWTWRLNKNQINEMSDNIIDKISKLTTKYKRN